jgi:hypothetical protein
VGAIENPARGKIMETESRASPRGRSTTKGIFRGLLKPMSVTGWPAKYFSTLSSEQRATVEQQLFRTVFGVVFSILVNVDQFPAGDIDLSVLRALNKTGPLGRSATGFVRCP